MLPDVDTTTDEGLQKIFDAYQDTPLGRRQARELKGLKLRDELGLARQGKLLTPEEYEEKTNVAVNLKAKGALEGLSNTLWRTVELAGNVGAAAAISSGQTEALILANKIMEEANKTANFASKQKNIADEEFENLQPDEVQRFLGTATEQVIQNAPSMVAAKPITTTAGLAVNVVKGFNEAKKAANVLAVGSKALTTLDKITDYEKIARVTSLAGSAGISGVMEGMPEYDNLYMRYIKEGYSEKDAKEMAGIQGLAVGLSASVMTAAFGTGAAGGVESIYNLAARERLRTAFIRSGVAALGEGAEEGLHGAWSGVLDKAMANPGRSMESIIKEGYQNFVGGFVFGGGVAIVADAHKEFVTDPAEKEAKAEADRVNRWRQEKFGSTQRTFGGVDELPGLGAASKDTGEDSRLLRPIDRDEYLVLRAKALNNIPEDQRQWFNDQLAAEEQRGQRGQASRWLANRIRQMASGQQAEEASQEATGAPLDFAPDFYSNAKVSTYQGSAIFKTDEVIRSAAIEQTRKYFPEDQLDVVDAATQKRGLGEALTAQEEQAISNYEGRIENWISSYKRTEQEALDQSDIETFDRAEDTTKAIMEVAAILGGDRSQTHLSDMTAARHANADGVMRMYQLRDKYQQLMRSVRPSGETEQGMAELDAWIAQDPEKNLDTWQTWGLKAQFYNEMLQTAAEIREKMRLTNVEFLPPVQEESLSVPAQQKVAALFDSARKQASLGEMIDAISKGDSPSELATKFNITPEQARAVRVVTGTRGYDVKDQFNEWIYKINSAPASEGAAAGPAAEPAPGQTAKPTPKVTYSYTSYIGPTPIHYYQNQELIPEKGDAIRTDISQQWFSDNGYIPPPTPTPEQIAVATAARKQWMTQADPGLAAQPKRGRPLKPENQGVAPQEVTKEHKILVLEWVLKSGRTEKINEDNIRKVLGWPKNQTSIAPVKTLIVWLSSEAGLSKDMSKGKFGAWSVVPEKAAQALAELKGEKIDPAPIAAASAVQDLLSEAMRLSGDLTKKQMQIETLSGEERDQAVFELEEIRNKIASITNRVRDLKKGETAGTTVPVQKVTSENAEVIDVNLKGLTGNQEAVIYVAGKSYKVRWVRKPKRDASGKKIKGFTSDYELQQGDGNWTLIGTNRKEAIEALRKMAAPPPQPETPAPQQQDPGTATFDPTAKPISTETIDQIAARMRGQIGDGGIVRTLIGIGIVTAAIVDVFSGNFDGAVTKMAAAGMDPQTAKTIAATVTAVYDLVRYGVTKFVDVAESLIPRMGQLIRPYLLDAYRTVRDNNEGLESVMDTDADLYRAFGGHHLALNPTEAPGSYIEEDVKKPRRTATKLKPRTERGQMAVPMIKSAIAPNPEIPSEPGYVYHVTNDDAALEIAEAGTMKPFWPYSKDEGRTVWKDDGTTEPRSYWTNVPSSLTNFVPPSGKPVVIRVRVDPKLGELVGPRREMDRFKFETTGHGDIFTRFAIPTERIEVLTSTGWQRMWDSSKKTKSPTSEAPSNLWPAPNTIPGIGQWSTETVDVGMTKLGPERAIGVGLDYDVGTRAGPGASPTPLTVVNRRKVSYREGYDPVPSKPSEIGAPFTFDAKGNIQQDYNSLTGEAYQKFLTIMRSRAVPNLKLEQWLKMTPSKMRKFATDNSFGNEHDLAIAMGRNIINDDGALHYVVTQYRKDRLIMMDNEKLGTAAASAKFKDARERALIWSSAIQAATATGTVGEQILILDPLWVPKIQSQFDWVPFLRENRQALEQLVHARSPERSVIFLRNPTFFAPEQEKQMVGGRFKVEKEGQPGASTEKRVEQMPLDTISIEYAVVHSTSEKDLQANIALVRPDGLKDYEAAYLKKMWQLMEPQVDRIITNDVRAQAREAAKAVGWKEGAGRAAGIDPAIAREQYPRLINAPIASPIGDHLHRKTYRMKNGFRTVAVETHRLAPEIEQAKTQEEKALLMAKRRDNPNVTVADLWPAMQSRLKVITAQQAAKQDHVVATVNGKFVGFYGWRDNVDDKLKTNYYALVDQWPASEYNAIPTVKYRPRVIVRGGMTQAAAIEGYYEQEILDPNQVIGEYDLKDLSDGQVRSMFSVMDELEAQPDAERLFRAFLFDLFGGTGRAESTWFSPKSQTMTDEVLNAGLPTHGPIVKEVNESKFARALIGMMDRAIMSDERVDTEANQTYVTVQIPGLTGQIVVATDPRMTKEAIYNAFIQQMADALTIRLAQVAVREKMGLEYNKTTLDTFKRFTLKNWVPQVGDAVLVRHGDEWVKGFVKKAYNIPVLKYDIDAGLDLQGPLVPPPKVSVKTTGVKGERIVYDVEVPGRTEELIGGKLRTVYITALTPSEIRNVKEEGVSITKQQVLRSVAYQRRTGVRPEMFDGQPLTAKPFLERDMRALWMEAGTAKSRFILRYHWARSYTMDQLLQAYRAIGATDAEIDRFKPERQEEILEKSIDTIKTSNKAHWQKMTPAERQLEAEKVKASFKSKEMGLLIDKIMDQYRHVYAPLIQLESANRRAKAYAAKVLLTRAPAGLKIPQTLQPIYNLIKNNQSKVPRQTTRLLKGDLEEKYLPPKQRMGEMTWRLVDYEQLRKDSKWLPTDDESIDTLMRMPMGKILLRVEKTGSFYATKQGLKFSEEDVADDPKQFKPKPVEAFLTVSKGEHKALISVVDLTVKGGYRAVYSIDLDILKANNSAQPWTKDVKIGEEVGPDGKTVPIYKSLTGWYFNPRAVANSAVGIGGDGVWSKMDHEQKQWLSVEHYIEYLNESMMDPSLIQGHDIRDLDGTPAFVPAESVPTGLGSMMDMLTARAAAGEIRAAEVIVLMNSTPLEDTNFWGWRDQPGKVMELLQDIFMPNWRKRTDNEYALDYEDLEAKVQSFMEKRFGDGMLMSVSEAPPTTADVDPSLLGREFNGRAEITELLMNPASGIKEAQRKSALALLRFLPDVVVDSFAMTIVAGPAIGGRGQRVFYGGSFSHLLRLARIAASGGDINAIAEEIAHAAAKFLPKVMQNEVERLRQAELRKLDEKPDMSDSLRDFLGWIERRGGQATSQEFVSANRPDWVPFYALINTDEYFAHSLTDAAIRAESTADMGRIRQFFYGLWRRITDAIKVWSGESGVARDSFFDELLQRFNSGQFTISMNGGWLAEINSHSDIASVNVSVRPDQFLRRSMEPDWRGISQFPNQTPDMLATMTHNAYFTLGSVMNQIAENRKLIGEEMSARAKGLVMLTNVENMLQVTRELMPTLTPRGYDLAKMFMPSEELRNQLMLGTAAAVHDVERQQESISRKWDAQKKVMESEAYANLIKSTAAKAAKIYPFETMVASVEAQIEAAMKALQMVSVARGASQEKFERAREDLRWLNRAREYAGGITQRMQRITDDLASIPEGFELLESGLALDPAIIERAWLMTNPPAEAIPQQANIDRDPAWAMQRVAFMLLAKDIRIRGQFAAASYSKEEAVIAALPGFAASLVNALNKERNATAIARLVRMNGRNWSKLEKAKRIVLQQERRIEVEANKMAAYDEAKSFMEELMLHPTFNEFRRTVKNDVGEKYVPRAFIEFGRPEITEEIVVPIPGEKDANGKTKKFVITIPNNEAEWGRYVQGIQDAMMKIQGYLSATSEESLERDYFSDWYDFLDKLQYATQFHHKGWNQYFGFKWMLSLVGRLTQHIESVLTMYPSRMTAMLRAPLRAWADSYALMTGKWKPKYVHLLNIALVASIRSHPEIDQGRGRANLSAEEWRNSYGRELGAFLAQGMRFEAGDSLPITGNTITQQDLDFFALQTKAIDEAMSYNVVRDREGWIPEPLREDKWVPGYKYMRRNIKTTAGLLTRKWNHEALDFTATYVRLIDQDRKEEAMRYLDANMTPILWFLAHRQAGWAMKSFGTEDSYAAAADELRAGRLKSMQDVLNFLDSNFGLVSDVVGQAASDSFMAEFDGLMRRIYNDAIQKPVGSDVGVTVKATSVENSFTLGSRDAMAPGWWYNWGITDTSDAMNFALSGSVQYLNEFKRMLRVVIETLRRNQEQVTSSASFMVSAATQAGQKLTTAQARLKLKSGKRTIDVGGGKKYVGELAPQEMTELIRTLEKLLTDIDDVYTPNRRYSTAELRMVMRIAGTLTGSILASVSNTMRNWVSGAFGYNAVMQKVLGRSLMRTVPVEMAKTAFKTLWAVSLIGPSAIVHLAKDTEWKSLAKNISHVLGKKSFGKWRPLEHLLKAEADFAPALQATVDSIVWKGKTLEKLKGVGLGMELDLRGMLYNFAEVVSQGGIISIEDTERSTHPFRQLARVAYGLADFHVLGLSRLLPRPGDMTANISIFNSSIGAAENIEAQLRSAWLDRKGMVDRGIMSSTTAIRDFTAKEVVPGFIRTPTGRQTTYNHIVTWFNQAGIDLNRTITDFYNALEGASPEERGKIRWLTEAQMFALAQEQVEAINVASPKNRPLLASKDTLHRIAFLLNGWNINMFTKLADWFGAARMENNAGGRALTKSAVVAMAALVFALNEMGLEELMRHLMWLYDKEAKPARQPWEVEGAWNKAVEVAVDITASVPVLAHVIQAGFNVQGGRLGQGLTIPAQNWVMQGVNYISGVFNTGDPTYGLDRLVRTWVPLSRPILNRLPQLSGTTEALNARRLLARHGENDLLREQRGAPALTGRMATALTPYADRMVNAAMHEDYEQVAELFDEAVAIAMEDPAYQGNYAEAAKRVRQLYTSRNAYSRAFKQLPTAFQRQNALSSMGPKEQQVVTEYERKFQLGGRRIGANVRFTADEGGQIRYDRGAMRSLQRIRGLRFQARSAKMVRRTRNPLTRGVRRL